jgi:hypothetical protein
MSGLKEHAAANETKAALDRALRQLDQAKTKKEDLVEAVYRAARDAAEAAPFPTVPKSVTDKRKRDAETAIVLLADWQLGKVTPSYSSDVCKRRIGELADKVALITDIQRSDHPVKDCRVYLLGDLVEGELIFPGQSHLIDASLFSQVMIDGPAILGQFVTRMLAIFETVTVVGVIGNHGAIGGRSPARDAPGVQRRRDDVRSDAAAVQRQAPHVGAHDPAGRARVVRDRRRRRPALVPVPRRPVPRRLRGLPLVRVRPAPQLLGDDVRLRLRGLGALPHARPRPLRRRHGDPLGQRLDRVGQHLRGGEHGRRGTPCQWLLFQSKDRVTAEYNVSMT